MTTTAARLVTEAKTKTENLDVERFAAEIARPDAVVVDLREPDELAETGRIPGSIHVPRGMLEFRADPTSAYHHGALDPAKRILLHCATGGRSALAAMTLRSIGYTDVAHLDGGIKAWIDSGRPLEPR